MQHERIRAVTPLPVRRVLLTNYHQDRAGGTAYWQDTGASVFATARTTRSSKPARSACSTSVRRTPRTGCSSGSPSSARSTGGCILKEQIGNLDGADVAAYPRTPARLKALGLPFDCIVAGQWRAVHGPEWTDTCLRLLAEHEAAQPARPAVGGMH